MIKARARLKIMKTSSSTKTTLNKSKLFTGFPFHLLNWVNGLLVLLTVSVFALLVKLGLWQYHKGEDKSLWQASLAQRQDAAPLSLEALLAMGSDEALTGFKLQLTASPVAQPLLILDNQVHQGQVGYLVFQLFAITTQAEDALSKPWLLVELGFIGADKDRRVLPSVQALTETSYSLSGRVYQRQLNPVSDKLFAEAGSLIRFQNLNLPALEQYVDHELYDFVLQPQDLLGLAQPWQPVPMPADKHFGYAFQWFTMASVFALMLLWLAYKRSKKQQ
jgi:cytochrome oxidase assembly protein ShyY1